MSFFCKPPEQPPFFPLSVPIHDFLNHFCAMLDKLKARWKVNGLNLLLIISTFALGGSLCGYAGRRILLLTGLEKGFAWIVLYILLVTLLWPLCVLLISIPLGQFRFFRSYIGKIGNKIRGKKGAQPHRVAIFASGAGSNARRILEHFAGSETVAISLVVCNKPGAGVLDIAREFKVPSLLIEKDNFFRGDHYLAELKKSGIDFIVLAGFLWKIPSGLIGAYPGRIINIHPALLPKYGGKGMYGNHVHEAVIAAGEKESGITIHYVDEQYDHGKTILQATCPVTPDDSPASLAQKIHALEHQHYPKLIGELLQKQNHR